MSMHSRYARWAFPLLAAALFSNGLVRPLPVTAAEPFPADKPVEEAIDHYIEAKLAAVGVSAAPQAPDTTLIRRTTLDLVGRIPTLAEAQAYAAAAEPDKRVALVDRLLSSPAFVRHQAGRFDAILMAGSGGNLRDYLQTAFQENRSWDRIFRELLLGQTEDAEQKGALQFVRSRAKDLDRLTNDVSVLFFGVNVSCAQCHDHPLVDDWSQAHFYGMKSFFSRTFENGDFIGERPYGGLTFSNTKGENHTANVMFLTGEVLKEPEAAEPTEAEKKEEKNRLEELKKNKQPPPAPSYSRRARLVEVALQSPENSYFARAIVNRLWHVYFGRGLVAPIDQMHSGNPPSHPELLDWLARDFAQHGFDLRRLTRGIVLSRAYARSSDWSSNDRPAADLFAVATVRPLSPFQYGMTLRMGSTNPEQFPATLSPEDLDKRLAGVEGAARGLAGQFEQPGDDFQVSIDEALLLSNGDRIDKELLRDGADSLVGKLKSLNKPEEAVDLAGWTVFGRKLAEDERQLMLEYLLKRNDQPANAYRQLVWAMLTSGECRFNY